MTFILVGLQSLTETGQSKVPLTFILKNRHNNH